MKPNLFQIKIVFLAACTFLGLSIPLVTNAQLTSGNNFIKGRYIEVGVAPNGTYGTSINAPSGYHSRSHISSGSMGLLGFVADPAQDGWTIGTPAYFGDYFLPASPYQAWGITVNSSNYFIDREATGGTTFPIGVTGGNVGNVIIGSQRHAIWQGDIGNLRIKKDIYFDTNSLYFVANITLRNRGVVDLSDVHYLQMVNPDNDAGHTSGTNLSTKDTIKFQNPNIDNKTLVIARGSTTNNYLGLGSKDCRAKVFKYNSVWPVSPTAKGVYDGSIGGFAYSGGTPSGNRCIGIVFNLDTLKGGDSTTFAYTYILKENDIDSAFIEIKPNWKYNGITYNSGDTIRACSGSVLPITIENGGSYTWNDWTPVAGLSTTSGTSNSITVSDTLRTYRAIGVNSASVCVTVLDTLYLTIAPNLLPDTPVVAANINYCHSDVTSAIAATGTSLKWYTVPTGGTFVSSVTPSSATPSITNYYVTQTNATTGCESPRKMVRVAINPKPDSVLISNLTPLTFCAGDSVILIANTKIFNGFGSTAYLQGSSASGTPYICDCPNGSVATGYQGNSGGLLDRFTLICKPINRFGVLGSATTLTSVNGIASGPNAYGPYTFASTGMMVGLNARNEVWSGGYFGEVTAFGQSQSYITGLGNNSLSPLTLSPVSSINPSTSLGNIFTPNGTVASGMFAYPTLYSSGVSLRYTPIGAYKYSYSWSSAPATDTNSSITVKTSGSYSFTVTNSFGCSATSPTVNITVNPIPTISGTLAACAGSTSTLSGSATAHATTPWTSSNTSIATVSSAGVVTGVSAGTVTITYRNTNNCTQTATFTVNPTPSIVGASSINLGGTTTLLGSGTAHATTPWASSNPRVATVSSTGVVTAVGLGTTIITFKNTTNCEARFFLTVNAPNPTGTCAFTQIGSGFQHSLGVKADSSLWAWGFNSFGQLGDGTATTRTTPIRIGTLNNWKLVRGGRFYTVSLNHSGKILAWGDNTYGQLGDGTTTNKSTPTLIGTDSNWSLIEAGFHHTIAIKNNGSLWAWGWNTHGQLGDGTTTDKTSPIRIGTDSNWKSIATGAFHSVALKKDGSIWAWGYNVNGEIGDGTTTYRYVPTRIGTDSNWVSVYAGFNYSMAIRSDGSLWAWGWNGYSQLGDGTMTSRFTPTRIGTDSNWAKAEGADIHTVAIKSNGSQWAWGDNSYGQLGDGTTISKSTPNRVGLDSNWILNQTFANTTLAIKNDGQLFGWGQNTSNQIGDGTTTNRNTPQIINPTPIISGTLSACVGFSSTLTATTTAHATTPWTSSNTAVASVSSTGIVTGISAGTVTITYRNTNNCIATAIFTVNPLPAAPATATTVTYCQDASATALSASGTSIKWYTSASGGTSSTTAPSVSTTTPGITTHYVTQTNSFGCESIPRTGINVVINPKPVAVTAIPASATTFCLGDSVILNASSSVFSGFGSTPFFNSTGVSGATFTCDCPNGQVAVGYEGRTGSWMDQFQLICKPLSRLGILGTTTSLTTSNGTSMGGGYNGPYLFTGTNMLVGLNVKSWGIYLNDISGFGQNYAYILGLGDNTVSPTALGTLGGGSSVTNLGTGWAPNGTVITGMHSYPTVYSTGVSFRYTPIGAFKYNYLWSTSATDTNSSITVKTSGAYTLTVTNSLGCSASSAPINVTVNPLPTISGTFNTCIGSTSTLIGSATAHPTTPWTSSNTAIATVSTTGVVTGVSAGTTTITYRNANNCTQSITFTVNALPTISGTLVACVGQTSTLTGSATAHATTPWTSSNTAIATVSSTGVVTGVAGGTAIITYRNTNGCTQTATFLVNPLPTISGTLSACVGQSSTLTGSASPDVITPWASSNTSVATVSSTGEVSGLSAGTTIITYKNSNGCIRTATFTVNPLPLAPVVTTPVNLCIGVSATALTATGTSLKWYTVATGGTSSTTAPTPSTTALGTTNYYVSQTNTFGCEGPRANIAVIVNPLPALAINSLSVSGFVYCRKDSVNLKAIAPTATAYQWSFASASLLGKTADTIWAGKTGFWGVTVTDALGCKKSDSVYVTEDTLALPTLSPTNAVICQEGNVLLTCSPGFVTYRFDWFKDALPLSSVPTTSNLTNANIAGLYHVMVTNNIGCVYPSNNSIVSNHPKPFKPTIINKYPVLEANPASYIYYQWYKNGAKIIGANAFKYTVKGDGDYYVEVTDQNGCLNNSDTLSFRKTSINNVSTIRTSIKIYPNPTHNVVYLEAAIHINVRVTDVVGRVVFEGKNPLSVSLQNLADGTYFFRISDENNNLITVEKITKVE